MSEPLLIEPAVSRAAVLTPQGRGAVAVVAAWGTPEVVLLVETCFRTRGPALSKRKIGQIAYGSWKTVSGEDIVAVRRSTTAVEIHCHGGQVAAKSILEDLITLGCCESNWQQWLQAEHTLTSVRHAAQIALSQAPTLKTARILLDQFHGAWEQAISNIVLALKAASISQAEALLEALLDLEKLGSHLTSPWKLVLAGSPNVGKSSLANALLGFERSIVYDTPGTTRDIVTSTTVFDGWPVELADTAGLHQSHDHLEQAGIQQARQLLETADLILAVFDLSLPWSSADEQLLIQIGTKNHLLVYNKLDLCTASPSPESWPSLSQFQNRPAGLGISVSQGWNLDLLIHSISQKLVPKTPNPGSGVPFQQAQIQALKQASVLLSNHQVAPAADLLASLLDEQLLNQQ